MNSIVDEFGVDEFDVDEFSVDEFGAALRGHPKKILPWSPLWFFLQKVQYFKNPFFKHAIYIEIFYFATNTTSNTMLLITSIIC
jgi:hypothetical protein